LVLVAALNLLPTVTNAVGGGAYTCDAALGDVPLTKARYASIINGTLPEGFEAVTCIPAEAFSDHTTPLSLTEKMPNLISIGDRAFFRFGGGEFSFMALDYSYLPSLEYIGVEAFAEFKTANVTEAVIRLKGSPSLISIGDSAFSNWDAPFLLLQVECACSRLEVISDLAFSTVQYGSTSSVTLTDLSRLRSIGNGALHQLGNAVRRHDVVFTGMSPLLTHIGPSAFR
jgi:hypothetical protein